MPKFITETNLKLLLDRLIADGKRVVAPKLAAGIALYEPLTCAQELVLDQLPRRSAKETFFPLCEDLLSYRKDGQQMQVEDVDPALFRETVLVGVRPCDAAAIPVLDAVFSWDFKDRFFLKRREVTTIIGIACVKADSACFCSAVGLSPAQSRGSDLFLTAQAQGGYGCEILSDKGEALVKRYAELFGNIEAGDPAPLAQPQVEPIDLKQVKSWLDQNFEHPLWDEIATRCVGCGACAFICPACHCFDIVDEGTEKQGHRRKSWDACGFWKFTHHASGHNPREMQPKRYRNRVMHKFKYYDDKFGQTLCTGCGRCVRVCPVGIDLAEVLNTVQNSNP